MRVCLASYKRFSIQNVSEQFSYPNGTSRGVINILSVFKNNKIKSK